MADTMLKLILEADKKERVLTQELKQLKNDIFQEVQAKKEAIFAQHRAAAQEEAGKIAGEEAKRADETIALLRLKARQAEEAMDQKAAQNMQIWVKALTERALLGHNTIT